MKRVLLIILAVAMLLTLCACGKFNAPSSAQVRKLIPQTVDVDPANYPLLSQAPPTVDEILGDTPRTFVFDESEWEPTENMYTTDLGYDAYTNADGEMLLYDDYLGTYSLSHGSINPDLTAPEDYYSIEYGENGELTAYTDSKYGYYPDGGSTEIYEDDVLIEVSTHSTIYVRQENADYSYLINRETGQVESIDVSTMDIEAQNEYTYFAFNYSAADKTTTNVTMTVFRKNGYYVAYYTDNGDLQSIDYLPNGDWEVGGYKYDKNYERITDEAY